MKFITKLITGNRVGTKALYGVIDPTTLDALPLSATDNADGTATLKIDGEFTASIDPGILATYAGQTAGNASLASIDGKQPALVDGQSPVVAGYKTVRSDILFTGMDATSQYDAVGALVEVPNWATANGRSATIREMRISVNNNAIAPQFEVHFFRASDVTVAADNASWTELAAEYAKRAGYIIMPVCAKASGSGTIDMVRAQLDDYGQGASKEISCASASSSIWIKLKLLTSGISFASTPGNQIVLSIVREQS